MKSRTLLATLVVGGALATAAALPLTATAFDGGSGAVRAHRGHGAGARILRMADELGLSDAQKAEVQGILESARPAAQALRQDMRGTLRALDQAITSGADNDTIAELAIEAHGLRAEGRELKKEVRQQIGAVLTPEQKAELKEMRQARRGERGGKGGHGGRGGGGFGDL